MTDAELANAFEELTLPPEGFRHADHVRVGFHYLRRYGLLGALERYRDGLRRYAAHHGSPERYHETVTWAQLILIHERMAERPELRAWPEFSRANPDLLRWRDGTFFEYYRPEILESEVARRTFVLPR